MEKLLFKTNIKCSGCIAQSTPFLNETIGVSNWNVDVQHPDKILTVTNATALNSADVINAVKAAGYTAEKIEK